MTTKEVPLISVIITDYNYGQYMAQAINSVLAQTYPNIELIIINDGSTDDSDDIIKKIISKHSERNIRYIHRSNKGIVYTRNEGLELAKGEFLCFLDADDYFNEDYVEKNYEIAEEYDADVVYPNWHYVGEWLGRPDTNFPEFKPDLLQLQKLHCTAESLIRKSAIKNHRFEAEKVAEDWDFFVGLSLAGAKFKLAKNNHINYRIRKGTRGSKNDPREDTNFFVDILAKHKNKHGDRVIDPAKLIADRHPNVLQRNMRLLLAVIERLRRDGISVTARKIVRRVLSRNERAWKLLGSLRNKKYQKVLGSVNVKTTRGAKLAIVVHLYYPDSWPIIKEKLSNINVPFDLFASVQMQNKNITLDTISKYHGETNVIPLPNRGRDVLPFLMISRMLDDEGQYKYLLKLHSKKSLHRNDGYQWMDSLLDELIPADISGIIETLEKADTGSIGPASHIVSLSQYMGANRERVAMLIKQMSNKEISGEIINNMSRYPFFGGTMFWCRLDFLRPLLDARLAPSDFNSEAGQVDGTTAHAVERILGKTLHKITGRKMYAIKGAVLSEVTDKPYTDKYRYVG